MRGRSFDPDNGRQKHWTDVDNEIDGSVWECDCGFQTASSAEANEHDQLGYIHDEVPGAEELEAALAAAIEKARAEGHAEGLAHAGRWLDANADMAQKKAESHSVGSMTRAKWEAAEYALDEAGKELLKMSEGTPE